MEAGIMRVLGLVTFVIVCLMVLLALIVGIRSIPDIRRYLKIKAM